VSIYYNINYLAGFFQVLLAIIVALRLHAYGYHKKGMREFAQLMYMLAGLGGCWLFARIQPNPDNFLFIEKYLLSIFNVSATYAYARFAMAFTEWKYWESKKVRLFTIILPLSLWIAFAFVFNKHVFGNVIHTSFGFTVESHAAALAVFHINNLALNVFGLVLFWRYLYKKSGNLRLFLIYMSVIFGAYALTVLFSTLPLYFKNLPAMQIFGINFFSIALFLIIRRNREVFAPRQAMINFARLKYFLDSSVALSEDTRRQELLERLVTNARKASNNNTVLYMNYMPPDKFRIQAIDFGYGRFIKDQLFKHLKSFNMDLEREWTFNEEHFPIFKQLFEKGEMIHSNRYHDLVGRAFPSGALDMIQKITGTKGFVLFPVKVGPVLKGGMLFGLKKTEPDYSIYQLFVNQCANILGYFEMLDSLRSSKKEQAKLLEELHQSQKLEAIGQLAGGVAHDFNNLLTIIMGAASILKNEKESDPDVADLSEKIVTASERGRGLTQNLLAFARKGKMLNVVFDLHETLNNVIDLISRTMDKRIDVLKNFSAERTTMQGDPGQIQNAFLNLALNARDAMAGGGTFEISTSNVSIKQSSISNYQNNVKPGEYILVQVSDTGTGIKPEVMPHIFEPFFTTKPVGKGTGLGLSGVYGCIKNHSGNITVESVPDKGATFIIYLPFTPESPSTGENYMDRTEKKDRGTVLVIDDEKDILDLCEIHLNRMGFTAVTCQDPSGGIEYFQSNHDRVNAVILDVTMPEMDGRTCMRYLSEINPEVRVILMTGHSVEGISGAAANQQIKGFIQKPFEAAEFIELVQNSI
jgi:signal transduction histidine kinase/CheY-like chemotaxis protein